MNPPVTDRAELVRKLIVETLPSGLAENGRIFGGDSPMDSLGLVNFLSDLEYRLSEAFEREIVLASDRAMSRQRSPFRDVPSLTEYVVELLDE